MTPAATDCLAIASPSVAIRPAPKAWAIRTVVPIETAKKAVMTMTCTWLAVPTPATAAEPSRATINVVMKPSAACMKFSRIEGQASPRTARRISPASEADPTGPGVSARRLITVDTGISIDAGR